MRTLIARALHNSGINAFTHPSSRSQDEWNEYRLKVADCLIEEGFIPTKGYESLLEDRDKLCALEGAGVDNWEGYDDAMESLEE